MSSVRLRRWWIRTTYRLEILETNCTDNLPNPKAIHLLQGEHGEILGRLEAGWEIMKVACCTIRAGGWSTKAAISETRREKLLWRACSKSPTLFRTVPSPIPYRAWGFATPPKTSIAIISGTGKAGDFKFGCYIHRDRGHPNKSPFKILEKKGVWAYCMERVNASLAVSKGVNR